MVDWCMTCMIFTNIKTHFIRRRAHLKRSGESYLHCFNPTKLLEIQFHVYFHYGPPPLTAVLRTRQNKYSNKKTHHLVECCRQLHKDEEIS